MYEWIEALGYEIEAAGRAGGARGGRVTETYRRGVERLGGTGAGRKAGSWVRSAGAVAAKIPVLSWQSDVLLGHHGVPALAAAVHDLPATDPAAGPAAIRLAEAIDAVRRDRLALLSVGALTSPGGAVLTTAALAVAGLGVEAPAGHRLVRRAHRIASSVTGRDRTFDELHTLARAYLAADKPRRALKLSYQAAALARRHADEAPAPRTRGLVGGLRDAGLRGAGAALKATAAEAVAPTYASLPERAAWERRCGAALVTAAWAHRRVAETGRCERIARTAVALGNTLGHLPLAAVLEPTGGSVRERARLVGRVEDRDRREYAGVSRGDLATLGQAAVGQSRKSAHLVALAADRVRTHRSAPLP